MIVEEQEDQDSGLREPAHLLHEKEAGLTIALGSFGMSLFTRKPPPSPMIQTVVKAPADFVIQTDGVCRLNPAMARCVVAHAVKSILP
jgi:hypothetical protein